jgi:non-canonical poly(A) RNA polymerase PAPD5/7
MTFSNGAGDSYRPAQSDFTFQSSHAAPHFPPAGPAADGGRATRSSRGRRGGRNDRGGRSNANGGRRGGAHHKAAPHERELLRHRDGGSPDISFGVEGPSRFMNLDDMSDHEEADMDESDVSAGGFDGAEEHGNAKVARILAPRADGDSVPKWSTKWSNPDPYTSLPPPSETTGVKKDVVQLIRRAKNQDAEKSIGNNAVAANDDFISFGDDGDGDGDDEDGEVDDDDGLMIYEDERLVQGRNRGNDNGNSRHPVEGRMNDLEYIASIPLHAPQHDTYQQQRGGGGRKRGYDDSYIDVVEEWKRPTRGASPSPWVASAGTYGHLLDQPQRW